MLAAGQLSDHRIRHLQTRIGRRRGGSQESGDSQQGKDGREGKSHGPTVPKPPRNAPKVLTALLQSGEDPRLGGNQPPCN
ncbi:hypothetical protein DB31_1713 [Hyalangium minutum]|uniref:Uncharacterized protein n=1 Tax=Hyalangium minutum TaxID=394096 RepID=A0A085WAI2_9BACT|nr:hypothetical protein DB31_1713 [Hyalangium minutum]